MTRIAVTGAKGQVATSLVERAGKGFEIVTLTRPAFSLEDRDAVFAGIEAARPDVIVNAAAYTAVDKAESEEDLAVRVNGEGAGHVAEAAARAGAPLLHLSTDYVFDGALDRPYREDDPTGPTGTYGRSKLLGEQRAAERCPNSAILRTAWVYSPFGANFVRTMLRLNETREAVAVVAEQRGNPTSALDLADALLAIARKIRDDPSPELRGVFHVTGSARRPGPTSPRRFFRKPTRAGDASPASSASPPPITRPRPGDRPIRASTTKSCAASTVSGCPHGARRSQRAARG